MSSITLGGVALAVLLVAAGCASPGTPTAPDAPGSLDDLPSPSPTGEVLGIGTVLGSAGELDGDQPMLCLGPVAESAPPQCEGPALIDWDWGAFEHQETAGVRWVQGVAVTGLYDPDGRTFTVIGDPMSAAAITLPAIEVPEGETDEATAQSVQDELMALGRADVFSSWSERGTVVLEVLYDDGTMQAALDAHYGEAVVFVISALRDTGEGAPDDEGSLITEPPLETAAPVITDVDVPDWLAELPRPSTSAPVVALGTVLEQESGTDAGTPMLCMMVLTSYPPQCGGPEVIGWNWDAVDHEEANGVRWSDSIALRITYDGPANTVELLEIVDSSEADSALPPPHTSGLDDATLAQLQRDLIALERSDILSFGGSQIEVIFDDGSIQAVFDAQFGAGNVQVSSWLG